MKYFPSLLRHGSGESLSLRRAWIEISTTCWKQFADWSLSLRRAWIEIGWPRYTTPKRLSRSPYGERGLKYLMISTCPTWCASLSLRRAWIEISTDWTPNKNRMSLSLRRAWIEITSITSRRNGIVTSLSLRRAWIEIASSNGAWSATWSLSLRRAWIEIREPVQ